ncbi:MAG TPA: glycosyltransferase family 2 protein [Bryobacteraceae bacterium]|nr:glycosyltransferase family 2 protein [Bryobacteraceae bacterium]
MKTISVITACFDEVDNVEELYRRVRDAIARAGEYRYEHIFIDNASRDGTVAVLKRIAAGDSNVRIIVNARNVGHIRSPMHAFRQATGDCVISLVADLQDPPEMIVDLIREWENGYSMVLGIKRTSEENRLMFWIRKKYYRLVNRLSSIETFENYTGFGLYDRRVADLVRAMDDPYPYFRGMIAEIGLPHKELPYDQPVRKHGITKNNLYSLYDLGMLGIINHSKVPLRLAAFAGFVGAALSFLAGFGYLIYKLLFWTRFSVGMAPVVIGIFLIGSIQLMFLGMLGEYVGAIHTQVQHRPLTVELERVNFQYEPGPPKAGPAIPGGGAAVPAAETAAATADSPPTAALDTAPPAARS